MKKVAKWKKWLIGAGITVVVLGAVGYVAMDYAVSYLLKTMGDSGSSTVTVTENAIDKIDDRGNEDLTTDDTSDAKDLSYRGEVSVDKAKAAGDAITLSEKLKISTVLLKKLGPSELNLFFDLVGGGMNTDEKAAAKRVILTKLSEKEYNDLIGIAKKYGLSNGKNYQDSLVEQGMSTPAPSTKPTPTPTVIVDGKAEDETYDSLVGKAKGKLRTLQSSCQSQLSGLANQYMETKDQTLIAEGQAALGRCDGQFESIVGQLNADLLAKGYSNVIVSQFRTSYAKTKSSALQSIINNMN